MRTLGADTVSSELPLAYRRKEPGNLTVVDMDWEWAASPSRCRGGSVSLWDECVATGFNVRSEQFNPGHRARGVFG